MSAPLLFIRPLTMACIMHAASLQHIPSVVIFSLLKTEGGHVGSWTTNTNGSHDLGPMQVNDQTWVPKLANMEFGGDTRKAAAALIYDGCYNVQVGAFIFKKYLLEAGGNFGRAVGYYNSHDPYYANRYRQLFLHSLDAFIPPASIHLPDNVPAMPQQDHKGPERPASSG